MLSRLQLEFNELKILYTPHLILKEVTLPEISLTILSFVFFVKKKIAFDSYYQKNYRIAWAHLLSLEDRFINGIVSYRIAYSLGAIDKSCNSEFYVTSYKILSQKSDTQLTGEEACYLAQIYNEGKRISKNNVEAIRLYNLSIDKGFGKAMVNMGVKYRDGEGVDKNYEMAINYFKKGVLVDYSEAKVHLAYMIELGYGINKDIKCSNKLYISAAKQGSLYAINKCEALLLTY